MIIAYYANGGPFPRDLIEVYRMVGCESDSDRRVVDRVLQRKFVLTDIGYVNERCEKIIAKQIHSYDKRVNAARKRWSNAHAMHEQSMSNQNQNQNQNQKLKKTLKSKPIAPSDSEKASESSSLDSVMAIPLNDGSEYHVGKKFADELEVLYPACDVLQTLREIRGWNLANPQKRKTKSGILRHINQWFAKEQNG